MTDTTAGATAPVKAIETEYKGVLFRSRLESRWAIFFDTAGIPWEYEPEAFGDGTTGYLPDFWLPDQQCYVEIKPDKSFDWDKIALAVKATGRRLFIAFGAIGMPASWMQCDCLPIDKHAAGTIRIDCEPVWEDGTHHPHPFAWADEDWIWVECSGCHRLDMFGIRVMDPLSWCCGVFTAFHSPRLHDAYRAAQTYRFWNPS